MSLTNYSHLQVILMQDGILQVTLSRPEKLNALNQDVLLELQTLLHYAHVTPEIKALLITGAGDKAFCAGADIRRLAELNGEEGFLFAQAGQAIFRSLEQLGKPSLAAINGYAFGGGCELAMSASLRIATPSAAFCQPEVKLGVIPGYGGTQRLARLVGKGRAIDLCITARTIDANTALAWGLISEIVNADQLLSRGHEILRGILTMSPAAVASTLQVIDKGYDLPLDEAFHLEAVHFGLACATADKREGVDAFLNKRVAQFTGE